MQKIRVTYILLSLFYAVLLQAQNEVIPIWDQPIPGAIADADYVEQSVKKEGILQRSSQVSIPTLTVFRPETANGTAMLILPGGGYAHLSMDKEGQKVAQLFNAAGITAFVLQYRLPSDRIMKDPSIGPLQDAQQAMRLIRKNAAQWHIDLTKIGVIGFSAGGHLAASLCTRFAEPTYSPADATSARPDFSILIYPVISMTDGVTHMGSKRNLLGENTSAAKVRQFSNEQNVSANTPPAFIVHAGDDRSVVPENSLLYYRALREKQVAAALHLFEKGGHGFGLGVPGTDAFWAADCLRWLQLHGYVPANVTLKSK